MCHSNPFSIILQNKTPSPTLPVEVLGSARQPPTALELAKRAEEENKQVQTEAIKRSKFTLLPHLHRAKLIWIIIWIAIWIAIQKINPFTRDIHCSIKQSVSHCCSLFSHCYIAIHLKSESKLSRSQSRLSVYTGQNFSFQIAI